MKIALCCNDTRGGVEPYAILGHELRMKGHDVTLIAPIDFAPLARAMDLRFKGLSGSQSEVASVAASIGDKGPIAALTVMLKEMPRRVAGWAREMLEGAEGADLLVGGIGGMVTGIPVADRLGVPFIEAHLQPLGVRSPSMNGILFGSLPKWIGPQLRLASQSLSDGLLAAQFASASRMARNALGSSPRPTIRPKTQRIFGFSPHIVPDTGTSGVATGYWHRTSTDWQPPPDLVQFLLTDKPLVVVGFGSIAANDPVKMHRLVVDTAERAGCKIVYLTGWTQQIEANAHPDVLSLLDVPHSWLFPRVQAVVHHGGAGTTGAAFAAGAPQIIVPFGVDQPFWASRVAALGTGPVALARRRMQAWTLADCITRVIGGPYKHRALAIAELLSVESGAIAAAKLIAPTAVAASRAAPAAEALAKRRT